MKLMTRAACVLLIVFWPKITANCAPASAEEQQLIRVLQSANSSPQERDAACARLKLMGTAASVPALAALLADEQLSHSARFALESMPIPEAGRALADGLGKTSGLIKAGIINSLGFRGERQSVPALVKLLQERDASIAGAAASALGKIGGAEALQGLQAALQRVAEPARAAVADALLACGNRLLSEGDRARAAAVFKELYTPKEKDRVRSAAFRGLLRAAGEQGLGMMREALQGNDGPSQIAALQWVREIEGQAATEALTALLPGLTPPVRAALIEALRQRGDPAAAPAIFRLAKDSDPAVRVAAINALGELGDAGSVPLLAGAAAEAVEPEQKAARQSLLLLRSGNVNEAMVAQLATAKPGVQVELARALTGRGETSAVPRLVELAGSETESAKAAYRALGLLGDARDVPALVRLLLSAKTEDARAEAQDALGSICQRVQAKGATLDVSPIVVGLTGGSIAARQALLQVCSLLVAAPVRTALQAALRDPDPEIQAGAIRAVCASRDPELLPEILSIAQTAKSQNIRSVAMRGYVRLVSEEDSKFSNAQRLEGLKQMLALAQRPEEKQLVLAGLSKVPESEALKTVLPLLEDKTVQAEAAEAATQIAGQILGAEPALARGALTKVLAATSDPARRQGAEALLQQSEAMADYITAWQGAGPFRQEGKNYAALFETAFAPETPGSTGWRPLPAGTDPKRPWLIDLLKAYGGEQCAAYARTAIYSAQAQRARLELGSDDGVKVWVNGQQVYANNTARPIKPGSDKADVNLKAGWNTLLLKITQNNLGWEYCARLVKPDGSRFEDLKVDATRCE